MDNTNEDGQKKPAKLIVVRKEGANDTANTETDTLLINPDTGFAETKKSGSTIKWWKKIENDSREEVPSISYFRLFRYTSTADKLGITLAVFAAMVSGCMLPFNTIVFANLLNAMVAYGYGIVTGQTGIADEFLNQVQWFAIYNCILGVVLLIGGYTATVFMNRAAYNQVFRIRQEYLKAAMNQDFEWYDLHETGDFSSKMSDDLVKLEDGIGEKATTFLYYQVCFFSSVTMAIIKGWKLALVCLTSFPITMLLVGTMGVVASRLSKMEVVAYGRAASVAEEVLSAIRTVYAFGGQDKEVERFQKNLVDAKRINIRKSLFSGFSMGLLFFCIFCTYALSFWYGVGLLLDPTEGYNTSTMIAVFFGVMLASANFGISSTLMEAFGMARGAGAQIFNLIDNVPLINPLLDRGVKPVSAEGNLVLKNVFFRYPSRPDVPVLNGVSLTVQRGQTVALVGASGSGKSTIIQLISRFYDPNDGTISLDGHNVRELSVNWLRAQIGLVGQEPVLFNTTIAENIRYGREDATKDDIEAAAKKANAHQFIIKLPKAYDTLVGERGAALSGGQKQRIAIARALVRDPKLLLLDEATSALDNNSEAKVQAALDKASEGRTTIVVAHRLSTIRNADLIYAFKDGLVVESGTHQELMKKQGVYYNMVSLQTLPELDTAKDNELMRQESTTSEPEQEILEEPLVQEEGTSEETEEVSFWRVLQLSKPEWKFVLVASTCSLLSGFSMPLLSVVFGDFVGLLSSPDAEFVKEETKKYSLMFVGIGVLSGVSNFTQMFLFGVAGECLTERLRRLMFQTILRQDISYFDDKRNSTGALCSKLSGEASYVQGATGQRIGTLLQAVGTLSLALVFALSFEWRVGLVAMSFVPVILAVMYKQGRMARAESFGTAKTMEDSTKVAVDVVSNIRTVASLGRERVFLEEYSAQLVPGLRLAHSGTHMRGLVFGLARALFNFVYAAAMFYGGYLIVHDGVPYEKVLKTSQALIMGTSSAANAFAFAPNFQRGLNAAGRVLVLLNRIPNILDPVKPADDNFNSSGDAKLEGVHFRYPTRVTVPVLRGIDLDIQRGTTVALVGSSGCGKSTIIQLLERFYDPQEGVVSMDNVSLRELRLATLRQNVGLVQQEPILFDRTIGENIAYGDNTRAPPQDEIIEAAKQANIHNFVTSLPLGYETRLGTKGAQLSGGQKQRVAIARALIRKPKILLLDEATSALDTESEKVVQEALDAAKQGRTCVMIAHRLSTVQDADAICVFHEGRVAERGTHAQLMARGGLYHALHRRRH